MSGLRYESIHHNIMAEASTHNKEMENLMGAEVLVPGIKDWKLQCIDDASHGINDASGQKPAESGSGQSQDNLLESQDADPAHGNINQ